MSQQTMTKRITPLLLKTLTRNAGVGMLAMILVPAALPAQDTRPAEVSSTFSAATAPNLPAPGKDNERLAASEIARLEKELASVSKQADPMKWARLQAALGAWWSYAPSGDHAADKEKSFDACRKALTILTPTNDRQLWIDVQARILSHLQSLSARQDAGQAQRLKTAIAETETFLAQLTREGDPYAWRLENENLARMWGAMATADTDSAQAHLLKSIAAYEKAFTGLAGSKSNYPGIPGTTQSIETPQNLAKARLYGTSMVAMAWVGMPAADDTEKNRNLQNVLVTCSLVLSLLPPEDLDTRSTIQMLCATCWAIMPAPNDDHRRLNLTRVLAICDAVQQADPKWERPKHTFSAMRTMLNAWEAMPAPGAAQVAVKLREQAAACERTLKNAAIKQAAPSSWMWLHLYLSETLAKQAQLPGTPTPQKADLLRRAIASDKAVRSATADQLGSELAALIASDAELKEILAAHRKAYEAERTKDDPAFDDIKPAQ
jgi:hypothetical protein